MVKTKYMSKLGAVIVVSRLDWNTQMDKVVAFQSAWNSHADGWGVERIAWAEPVGPGENPVNTLLSY